LDSDIDRIVVVGAGPKGLAIAAKWTAYRECGYKVPWLTVIDRASPGAHWGGNAGYTDGHRLLCTLPERDVGFPYIDKDQNVSRLMLQKFSWQAFQIDTGRYAEWIDRNRPQPRHTELQEYIDWVARRCSGVSFITGDVNRIRLPNGWRIDCTDLDSKVPRTLESEVIVFTGPGESVRLAVEPPGNYERLLDGFNFWQSLDRLRPLLVRGQREWMEEESVTVIGTGGTAATIVAYLAGHTDVPINVVSRDPALFSRGEGYSEIRSLSDPADWIELPLQTRRDLIRRTDRGVVSAQNMKIINHATNVIHHRIDVEKIAMRPMGGDQIPSVEGTIELFDEFAGTTDQPVSLPSGFVVDATGFDAWWFTRLFIGELAEALNDGNLRTYLEERVNANLAIPIHADQKDLTDNGVVEATAKKLVGALSGSTNARIVVPMVAGIAQGPGFPNLTCLGLLANRILEPFIG
jgi:mycobactin lysine-N-oxygenase